MRVHTSSKKFCDVGVLVTLAFMLVASVTTLPSKMNGNLTRPTNGLEKAKEIDLKSCSNCYGYECCEIGCCWDYCGSTSDSPSTTDASTPEPCWTPAEPTCPTCDCYCTPSTCEPCECSTPPDCPTPTEPYCPPVTDPYSCEPCTSDPYPCTTPLPVTCPPQITCPPEKTCPPVTCSTATCPTPPPCPTQPVNPSEDIPKFSKTFYQSSLPSWPTAGTTIHLGMNATTFDNQPLQYQLVTSFEFFTLSASNDIIFINNVSDGAYVGPNNVMVVEVLATVVGDDSRQGSATIVIVFPRSTATAKEVSSV